MRRLECPGQGGLCVCACAKLLQPCPTLCDPMDCSPPCSSAHGILQARILEWVVISSPGDIPDPGMEPVSLMSPALALGFFTTRTTWEAQGVLGALQLASTYSRRNIYTGKKSVMGSGSSRRTWNKGRG